MQEFYVTPKRCNVIDHRAGQLAAARRRKVLYTGFEAFLPTNLIYIIYKNNRLFVLQVGGLRSLETGRRASSTIASCSCAFCNP